MPASILVIFAHPAYQRSRANRALRGAIEELDGVRVHDIYDAYPDFLIDVEREQHLLAAADILMLQHPFYWYSAPALIKEWMDLVLTHGWAYGAEGRALFGKVWTHAITTGGREESYEQRGHNRFTMAELLRPFEATAHLCNMHWREPYVVHASRLRTRQELTEAAQHFRAHVLGLQRARS